MSENQSIEALNKLEQTRNDVMKELDSYPKDLLMFWHENDLRAHLCHRFINYSGDRFDVHANAKLETREGAWGDALLNNIREAVKEIKTFRYGKNYVDVVINIKQDDASPFWYV